MKKTKLILSLLMANLMFAVAVASPSVSCEQNTSTSNDALYIFLAITGKPTDEELISRVQNFADAGVDGFVIYARDGLEYEYMGEEWLHVNELLCGEAEKKGLKVYLYDEFAWPSGRVNGKVGRENEAFRYCEDAVYQNDDKSFCWKRHVGEETSVNVLEKAAMKRFIELTHNQYQKRLERWCKNGTIKGIFTDEPGHPYTIKYEKEPLAKIRTWSTLSNDYYTVTGRDFRSDVEAWILSGRKTNDITAKVWEVYAELQGRQFRMSYCDQIAAKTREMGIESTGHMIGEESVLATCFLNGNILAAISGLTLPGIDDIVCRTRYKSVYTYSIGQYAALKRGNGAMIELFALGPADTTAAKIRQFFWISALFNINQYLCSMDSLDMKGLYKRNAYLAPFGAYQPWWKGNAKVLCDEARRAAKYALNRKFFNDVAIRYPQNLSARNAHCAKHDGYWGYSGTFQPKIAELMNKLQLSQISAVIVEENDTPDSAYIFSFTADNKIREERSHKTYDSIDDILKELISNHVQVLHLEEKDGSRAKDILLRNYDNGKSIAVNMSDSKETRHLFAVTKDGKTAVALSNRGILELDRNAVIQSDNAAIDGEKQHEALQIIETPYAIKLDRANYKRIAFTSNRVARIKLNKAVNGIRFAILEKIATGSSIKLDGKALLAENSDNEMPANYSVIYKSTSKMTLDAGEHIFELSDEFADDNYFLPLMVMIGEFSDRKGNIDELPGFYNGEDLASLGLDGFTGTITYCADVEIADSNDKLTISLNPNDAFAEVLIDGESIGVKAWTPYTWDVPEKFKGGKHCVEVKLTTNITSLWGDLREKDTIYAARPNKFYWGILPRTMDKKNGLSGKILLQSAPIE